MQSHDYKKGFSELELGGWGVIILDREMAEAILARLGFCSLEVPCFQFAFIAKSEWKLEKNTSSLGAEQISQLVQTGNEKVILWVN